MARPRRRPGAGPIGETGVTVLDLVFVLAVIATVSAVAVPAWSHITGRYSTLGAVRAVTAALQDARVEAVARGVTVAVRFTRAPEGIQFTSYVDGNRDGISTADIRTGVDPLVRPARGLGEFGGATFGVWTGVPAPDGSDLNDGDPIRVGVANLVSFTPSGTATAGSLYVRGPAGLQFVVRIHGDTGKTQVLRYARGEQRWVTQ